MEMWYHLDFSSHFEHNNASSKFNVTPKYYLKKQKYTEKWTKLAHLNV